MADRTRAVHTPRAELKDINDIDWKRLVRSGAIDPDKSAASQGYLRLQWPLLFRHNPPVGTPNPFSVTPRDVGSPTPPGSPPLHVVAPCQNRRQRAVECVPERSPKQVAATATAARRGPQGIFYEKNKMQKKMWNKEESLRMVEERIKGTLFREIAAMLNREQHACEARFWRIKKESPYKEIIKEAAADLLGTAQEGGANEEDAMDEDKEVEEDDDGEDKARLVDRSNYLALKYPKGRYWKNGRK